MPRIALAFAVMLFAFGHHPVLARADTIAIQQAFARATPPGAKNSAAYMTIVNHGTADDRLVSASTPIATRAEFHETISQDGVMKMRAVDGIEVKAGGHAMLKPGGYHLMLLGLKAPLKQGETFPLTLVFTKAGQVAVTVTVEKPGATGMSSGMGM